MIIEDKKSRQWEWQKRKLAAGLCMICGKERKPGNQYHCFFHAREAAMRQDPINRAKRKDKNVLDADNKEV